MRDEKAVPVLYLDLDGTVREGKDDALERFVNGPEDVRVFPEAVAMMSQWKAQGGRIVGVSNQGGIALGLADPNLVAQAMLVTQSHCNNLFDLMSWCSHHPSAQKPEMARCWCRKPAPGLLIESALTLAKKHHEYYPPHMGLMVGDRQEDEACAKIANVDFMWASDWRAWA